MTGWSKSNGVFVLVGSDATNVLVLLPPLQRLRFWAVVPTALLAMPRPSFLVSIARLAKPRQRAHVRLALPRVPMEASLWCGDVGCLRKDALQGYKANPDGGRWRRLFHWGILITAAHNPGGFCLRKGLALPRHGNRPKQRLVVSCPYPISKAGMSRVAHRSLGRCGNFPA